MPDPSPIPQDVLASAAALQSKFLLRSRVIQGLLVMLLALLAPVLRDKLGLVIDAPEEVAAWLTDQLALAIGLTGAVWAGWGRIKASAPVHVLPKGKSSALLLALAFGASLSALSACAPRQAAAPVDPPAPVEAARLASASLLKAYAGLHAASLELEGTLKGDELDALHKANAALNQARPCLVLQARVVALWSRVEAYRAARLDAMRAGTPQPGLADYVSAELVERLLADAGELLGRRFPPESDAYGLALQAEAVAGLLAERARVVLAEAQTLSPALKRLMQGDV